jgi:hypothetical protein
LSTGEGVPVRALPVADSITLAGSEAPERWVGRAVARVAGEIDPQSIA